MKYVFFLIAQTKDTAYYIGYWLTAFLPVLLGFILTILIIWFLTKKYDASRESDGFIGEKNKKDKK